MEMVIVVFLIAAALIFSFARPTRNRADLPPEMQRPKRQSRRERTLAAYRAANPDPEIPSMFDLMMEEAMESGVNEIPGSEDLELPVKLKVWQRDIEVRDTCDGDLRFEVDVDVEPSRATPEQVRLVCDGHETRMEPAEDVSPDMQPSQAEPGDSADGEPA